MSNLEEKYEEMQQILPKYIKSFAMDVVVVLVAPVVKFVCFNSPFFQVNS